MLYVGTLQIRIGEASGLNPNSPPILLGTPGHAHLAANAIDQIAPVAGPPAAHVEVSGSANGQFLNRQSCSMAFRKPLVVGR
jgi:hypothetical protein